MDFTTYQYLAFVGGIAGMAIVFGFGYLEGRRAHRQEISRICQARADEIEIWRHKLQRAEHEHGLSRLSAAQAIEAVTQERDAQAETAATLRLRLTTANERVAVLKASALTDEAAEDLAAMAGKLSLAATQFALMGAIDQATSSRNLAAKARDLSERYYAAQPPMAQSQEAAA